MLYTSKVSHISTHPSTPTSTNYTCTFNKTTSLTPEQPFSSNDYENVMVVKMINRAKFPVFLVFSPDTKKYLALKTFDFQSKQSQLCFNNEVRFVGLRHKNIINTLYADEQMALSYKNQHHMVSCLLMEYAPYGHLNEFIQKLGDRFTEKLTRTYFKQLIQALEYLHNNDVCHLDIKPENILIGDDYQLKIADFDLSYIKGDPYVITEGSKYFRAPELIAGKDTVGSSVDIYSAGIILFYMKCRGVLPHTENKSYKGVDLLDLLESDPEDFFDSHAVIQEKDDSFFDNDFKELFVAMTKSESDRRITIEGIKRSKWYNGPVYSSQELKRKMDGY